MRTLSSILPLFLALFLFLVADHVYVSVWPYYTREAFEWSSRQVGLTLAIFGFFHALTQAFLVGALLRKHDELTIALIGIFSSAVIMFMLLFITQGWIIYLFLPFTALGGLATPGLQSLMTQKVPETHQGQLQGGIGSLTSLTTILSPLIMTRTFHFFHPGSRCLLSPCRRIWSLNLHLPACRPAHRLFLQASSALTPVFLLRWLKPSRQAR